MSHEELPIVPRAADEEIIAVLRKYDLSLTGLLISREGVHVLHHFQDWTSLTVEREADGLSLRVEYDSRRHATHEAQDEALTMLRNILHHMGDFGRIITDGATRGMNMIVKKFGPPVRSEMIVVSDEPERSQ
jgi:hypothetical protein